MWFHKDILHSIVESLTTLKVFDEIIVISNNKFEQDWSILNPKKLIKLEQERNIGCNPAWNLGVNIAKNDKLFLLNDDFLFKFDIAEKIEPHITENVGMIGCNTESNYDDSPMRLEPVKWPVNPLPAGFACGFFIHKNVYLNNIIPEHLKLHCGDNWLLDTTAKQHYIICGIPFMKQFSGTIPRVRSLSSSHPLYIDSHSDESNYAAMIDAHKKYVSEYQTTPIIL
jgi:hypothetical protein